jgi:protocatechuate 3,4-dioxygenase beta subunit
MKNKIVRTVLPVWVLVLFSVMSVGCPAQENQSADATKRVGGPFENAEYFYYGMPENPESTHTSRGWTQTGPKLVLTGTVYQRDGKTPTPGIVLYYYHTGTDGLYSNGPGADKRAMRHGYLRGWVKSDAEGKYTIRTIRPAAYPNEKIPAHIHFAVKEPKLNEYYVDDVVFDDDPLLTADVRKAMEDRAGSGIVQLKKSGDTLTAQRDFILGLNIPDYPAESATKDNKTTDAKLIVPPVVIDGKNPGIEVTGLNADEVVRIHVLRSLDKWKEENGQWAQVRQSLHAYADFAATADGTVKVDTQTPLKGTYTTAEPLALLRTGYRFGDPALQGVLTFDEAPLKSAPATLVWVKLERNGKISAEASFELTEEAPGIEVVKQLGDGWHAVYAYPKAGEKLPVVISLHGSEGGSVAKARSRALQLASNNFAAVGVNYFAYPHEAIQGIPSQLAEIKIEILESIREWLKSRPEVDIDRIHVVGVSKGAEFALIAASQFDWIKSTVAIVPSESFGRDSPTAVANNSPNHPGQSAASRCRSCPCLSLIPKKKACTALTRSGIHAPEISILNKRPRPASRWRRSPVECCYWQVTATRSGHLAICRETSSSE